MYKVIQVDNIVTTYTRSIRDISDNKLGPRYKVKFTYREMQLLK